MNRTHSDFTRLGSFVDDLPPRETAPEDIQTAWQAFLEAETDALKTHGQAMAARSNLTKAATEDVESIQAALEDGKQIPERQAPALESGVVDLEAKADALYNIGINKRRELLTAIGEGWQEWRSTLLDLADAAEREAAAELERFGGKLGQKQQMVRAVTLLDKLASGMEPHKTRLNTTMVNGISLTSFVQGKHAPSKDLRGPKVSSRDALDALTDYVHRKPSYLTDIPDPADPAAWKQTELVGSNQE